MRSVTSCILFSLALGCAPPPKQKPPVPVIDIPPVPEGSRYPSSGVSSPMTRGAEWRLVATIHELMDAFRSSRRVALVVDHAESGITPVLLGWWEDRRIPAEYQLMLFDGSGSPKFLTQALVLTLGGSYVENGQAVEVPLCAILEPPLPPSRDLSESVAALFLGANGCTSDLYNWLYTHEQ